ncbi:MAG: hypothetical protein ACO21Q_05410, partial [Burkholderiaceae bacterium]|jgi:hypothetical protein
MTKSRIGEQIPSLKNWGGIRSIQRRMERSGTMLGNKEAIAYQILAMMNTKLTDIMSWDEDGKVKIKPSHQIPEHALQSIKNIKVRTDRDGNTSLEIELFDKVGVLRLAAKASGLLDNPDDNDKPSVIDVNVVAPDSRE